MELSGQLGVLAALWWQKQPRFPLDKVWMDFSYSPCIYIIIYLVHFSFILPTSHYSTICQTQFVLSPLFHALCASE